MDTTRTDESRQKLVRDGLVEVAKQGPDAGQDSPVAELVGKLEQLTKLTSQVLQANKQQGWGYIKILNSGKSGEFDNYEIALPFPAGTSPERINEGRKVAQMLVDEAFRQRRLAKSLEAKLNRAEAMKDEALNIAQVQRHLWSEEMEEIYEKYSEGMEQGRHRFHYHDDEEQSWADMDIPF